MLYENLPEWQAFSYEIWFIYKYGRKDNGTGILQNRTDGGEGQSGNKKSKSDSHKKSISEGQKALGDKHWTKKEDVKNKISESLKGTKHSKDRKPSYGNAGNTHTEESKQLIREKSHRYCSCILCKKKICIQTLKQHHNWCVKENNDGK
jgi:hypothetical protein